MIERQKVYISYKFAPLIHKKIKYLDETIISYDSFNTFKKQLLYR